MYSFDLESDCTFLHYTSLVKEKCQPFSCGNQDLDDFFGQDAFMYDKEMLGKSYCWVTNTYPHEIVGVVTVANDSIKSSSLPSNSRNHLIRVFDNQKRIHSYPSVLIGRLGVNIAFQNKHIGTQIMDFIKMDNIASSNTNACRFLVVDAYNDSNTLRFYERNEFVFMHKSEEIERFALRRYNENGILTFEINPEEKLLTRMMYYDLKKSI